MQGNNEHQTYISLECLLTYSTLERPTGGVDTQVFPYMRQPLGEFATHGTLEVAFLHMYGHMLAQRVLRVR